MFWTLFIFHKHSTPELASSRVHYFILRAYTGTSVSNSQHRKKDRKNKVGRFSKKKKRKEKLQVNGAEK